MIELETIEKDVFVFHTPYCDFSFTDSENRKIRFDIMEAPQKEIYIGETVVKSFCDGRTMRIYTENLELKKNYYIRPSVYIQNYRR